MTADFDARNAAEWADATGSVASGEDQTLVCTELGDIVRALGPFMGQSLNHTHLPTGGGHVFLDVRLSDEAGCVELQTSARSWHVVKPKRLTLEVFAEDLRQSFLLLELNPLEATEAYDEDRGAYDMERGQEEVARLPDGEYIDRSCWDEQTTRDDDGNEIRLPDDAILAIRWLRGQLLVVATSSLWNRHTQTYDGIHNNMNIERIKGLIQGWIAQGKAMTP